MQHMQPITSFLLVEQHDLLAVVVEQMQVVMLLLEGQNGLQGINHFLLRWLVRSCVLQVGLDVVSPLELAVVDLEVEQVAIAIAEAEGFGVPGELKWLCEHLVVHLDEVPESFDVGVVLVHFGF
jgi:hypothetical protein